MFRIFKDKILGKKNRDNWDSDQELKLNKSLKRNIKLFKEIFKDDETLIFQRYNTSGDNPLEFCLIFIDGMINSEVINDNVIAPLTNWHYKDKILNDNIKKLLRNIIHTHDNSYLQDVYDIVERILNGETLVLIDGLEEGIIIGAVRLEKRGVQDSSTEKVVRGPREGFVEDVATNTTLIRRRIKDPDLKFKFKEIGERTRTKVCVCYLDSLVNKKILDEVYKRLDEINIDGILESGYIQELIQDSPLSPFNTIGNTERPDRVAARILEGRIAILVDGTPFVLTVPHLWVENFQYQEDYYDGFIWGSINRIISLIGFFLATSLPAIYVALTTYHQEMIPTPLLLSISGLREGVPFPTIVEAILMLFFFEIIREGGLRIPSVIGPAISFVGALIIGQSAVQARLFSAPIVIVIALTGVANFLTPKMLAGTGIVRMILLLLASFLGLYGYIFGVIGVVIHLFSMRSFGVPYMMYMGSIDPQEMKDTAIRAPWWVMYVRPKIIGQRDAVRKGGKDLKEREVDEE